MASSGDELTVNASNNFTLTTGAAIPTATINNTGSAAITVTKTGTISATDKLALSGNDIVIKDATAAASTVAGVEVTSTATKSTIELSHATAVGAALLNEAQVSEVLISGAGATSITVNENSKLVLAKNQATGLTANIENASTTPAQSMSALGKTGTLLLDVNATQTVAITAGANVDTVLITAGALENDANGNSQTVTLADLVTAAATNTVVFNGANNVTLTKFTATDGDETIVASGMTGNLTINDFTKATTVHGGTGNDVISLSSTTVLSNGIALKLHTGAGDDTVNLYGRATNIAGASIVNTGTGNDTITTSGKGDTIDAGAGDDKVTLTAGTDTVTLGTGSDTVVMASNAANNSTIKDFAKGTDTLVLTGAGVSIDLGKLTAPTANKYVLGGANLNITLTGVTATDLSDSIQLGKAGAAFTLAADATVVAGAKDDVISVATTKTSTITTGAGSDTVILTPGATGSAVTVTDFTVGSDKVVLTGTALAATTVDLTKATVTAGAITYTGDAAITLKNAGTAIVENGTQKDVSTMIQLGVSATDTFKALNGSTITGGTFDDFITLAATGAKDTVNFIDNGGMDTVLGFLTGEDKLSFGALTGIVADQSGKAIDKATAATSGDVYVMTANKAINGDTIDYSKLFATTGTKVNNEEVKVTDASIMADVAGYLNNALTGVKANHAYVAVINDATTSNNAYAYLINATSETITVDDITLIGTVNSAGDIVATDIA